MVAGHQLIFSRAGSEQPEIGPGIGPEGFAEATEYGAARIRGDARSDARRVARSDAQSDAPSPSPSASPSASPGSPEPSRREVSATASVNCHRVRPLTANSGLV